MTSSGIAGSRSCQLSLAGTCRRQLYFFKIIRNQDRDAASVQSIRHGDTPWPPQKEKASPAATFRAISANPLTHVIEIAPDSGGPTFEAGRLRYRQTPAHSATAFHVMGFDCFVSAKIGGQVTGGDGVRTTWYLIALK